MAVVVGGGKTRRKDEEQIFEEANTTGSCRVRRASEPRFGRMA